jgi:rhodanese-related sulfurtransferase
VTPVLRPAAALLVLLVAVAGCGAPAPTDGSGAGAAPATAASAVLPAEVDVDGAVGLLSDGALAVDVREPDEWASGHIDGAVLIPLGELSSRIAEVPADRQVVVVCRSGNRSAQGRDILLAAGHPSVTSLAGGMTDWAAAGRPVVTGP